MSTTSGEETCTELNLNEILETLAPGVLGYTCDTPDGLYVPFISAEQPGNGDVSRYLDSLTRERRVVSPNVISKRLAEMLIRRGFTPVVEEAEGFGPVDVWERGTEACEA